MLRNHLLVAIRSMLRNKAISLIHICGFGLGLAAFLFAIQTVIFEYSFDDFHDDKEKIFFSSVQIRESDGKEFKHLSSVPALYHRIKANIPEVEYVARYFDQSLREPYCVFTYNTANGEQVSYNETRARYVDEDFLKIFDFPLIKGDRNTALSGVSSLVLTQSVAQKYFGSEDPIGKIITLSTGGPETRQTNFTYEVTGVLKDIPDNSSLQFEILLPFRNFEENYNQDVKNIWHWARFFTFIKTKGTQNTTQLEEKINALGPQEERMRWKDRGITVGLKVESFANLHFSTGSLDRDQSVVVTHNPTYTLLVGLIGTMILIVAGVNYINLTTAKSIKRAKEVGIRKVIGASRFQLVRQFLLDALLITSIGFVFALTLLQLVAPLLKTLTGNDLTIFTWNSHQGALYVVILSITILVNGIIPAFLLAGMEPVKALKSNSLRFTEGGIIRKGLVVFQFVVSAGLIIFTFTIFLQIEHLRSRETGFQSDHRIIIKNVGTEDFDFEKFRAFKERLLFRSAIKNVTGAMAIPGAPTFDTNGLFTTSRAPNDLRNLHYNAVDHDFAKTMGIAVVAGREFTIERASNEKIVMINESAVKEFGFTSNEDALEEDITFIWTGVEGNIKMKIVGIVEDVSNQTSPGVSTQPEVFMFANTGWPYAAYNFFIIHIAPDDLTETLDFVQQEWKDEFPKAPFEYTFQDEVFQRIFQHDERIETIAGVSTALSILIACMGLAGLVAFSMTQRTKEIGIRKTLGATVRQILFLLSGDFVQLICVSIVLAIPMGWFAAREFLKSYDYRIQISAWMLLAPCLILLCVALTAISYQTIRTAKSDPVKALRYE